MDIRNREAVVVRMYLEDKLSATQISNRLGISSAKVLTILKRENIQKRSISEAITQINITKFNKAPFHLRENISRKDNDLKITGIMLYWGEGGKTGNTVNFANSNPEMIRVFLLFLRDICGIHESRVKILIHMYPDQDARLLKDFWFSVTKIRKENFYRSHVHQGKKGTYKTKSLYGTATISYSDKKLLKIILGWIEEYKNNFLSITPK